MHRQIEPPAAEIIAERACDLLRERKLGLRLEPPLERGVVAARAEDRRAQRHEPHPHPREQRRDPLGRRAGFVILEQRVIGAAAGRERLALFAAQPDHLREHRQEMGDIVARARLGPDPLRKRGRARDLLREGGGHLAVARIGAPDQAQMRGLDLIARGGAGEPVAEPRVGPARVQHPLECGGLLGALRGGAARHHRLAVPVEPARDLRKRLGLALKGEQFLKCTHAVPSLIEPARG